jgi:hypothetical protein
MHTKVQISEGMINEQYHYEEFIFPEVPLETKDNPRREMAHEIVKEETSTFRFSIRGSNEETKMKNIPHSTLSNFHGLSKEDPNTFLFEFDVLCRSYDYVSDAHKLNLFPSTLKDVAMHWFMGLGRDNIHTWDQMMKKFLEKYQDYCKDKERREEVFRMMQHEDESLEDYIEWFNYNLQRERQGDLASKT